MPDGMKIPGGPVFVGFPQPPDVPCDPSGDGWRGPPGPVGPQGVPGMDGGALSGLVNVLEHGAKGDGTTDDTAAITAVLNAYAGKATIFFPVATSFYLCFPLVIPGNSDLLILGTIKAPSSASPNGVLVISNSANVTIRGSGTIDGNSAAPWTTGTSAGILVSNSSNVHISGLRVQNARNWNLNVVNSSGVMVDKVTMLGSQNSPEFAQNSTNCWITNSYINGPLKDGGFAFYGGVTKSGAIGNVFTGAYGYGCYVVSDPGQPNPCDGIVISNNVIFGNGDIGIGVLAAGVGGAHSDITISDNVLYNNCQAPIAGPPPCDIFLASCWYSIVANNKMRLCNGAGAAGIMLSAPTYGSNVGVTITGNSISDEGQGSATGVGIFINANSNEIFISGNHIFDTQATKTMQYGIAGACGATTSIVGNHFGALINPPLSITTVADTVVANSRSSGALFSIPYGVLSTVAPMQWTNASSAVRWFVGNGGNTESGSDTGSDFEIVRSGDTGTLSQSLSINRATGQVTMQQGMAYARVSSFTASYSTQGAYIMWSRAGNGFTNFVNNRGLGTGGFNFFDTDGTTDVPLFAMNRTNMTFNVPVVFNPMPFNAANDAAAATGGVPVGGVYRSGSALMVRTV